MAKLTKVFKPTNTTEVSNDFLRDLSLDIKGRGLLMTILSLEEGFDFSAENLSKILPDGKNSINSTLNDLEKHGYLIRRRVYENNKIKDWEYIFSDYKLADSEKHEQNSNNEDIENLYLQNRDVVENKGFFDEQEHLDSRFIKPLESEEDIEKILDSSTKSFKKYVEYEDMCMSENDYYELEKLLKESIKGTIDASKSNVIKYVKSLYSSETKTFNTKYGEPIRSLYGFVMKSFKHKTEQDKQKAIEKENEQFISNDYYSSNNKDSNNPYSIYND